MRVRSMTCLFYMQCAIWLVPGDIPLFADGLAVTSPADDSLIHEEKVLITGQFTGAAPGAPVKVNVWQGGALGSEKLCAIEDEKWELKDFPLLGGLNVLRISCGSQAVFLRINAVQPPVKSVFKLKVFLRWPDEPDNASLRTVLKKIPFQDMRDLTDADIFPWTELLKHDTRKLIENVFWNEKIPLTIVDAPGADVQTIRINSADISGADYGVTREPDYGNVNPNNECDIYLSVLLEQMSTPAMFYPLDGADKILRREDNIAHFIAYACAHELGHCMGLVGCDCFTDKQGSSWMLGKNGGHNPEVLREDLRKASFPDYEEQASRGGKGLELMDDGGTRPGGIYTAHPDGPRIGTRWIFINALNRAYLKMLYPEDP